MRPQPPSAGRRFAWRAPPTAHFGEKPAGIAFPGLAMETVRPFGGELSTYWESVDAIRASTTITSLVVPLLLFTPDSEEARDGRREVRTHCQRDERVAVVSAAGGVLVQGEDRLDGRVRKAVEGGGDRSRGVLGQAGQRRTTLVPTVHQSARLAGTLRQLVRRRKDQRLLQLSGCPSGHAASEQGGDHLGRRARRHPRLHLSNAPPRSLQVR